MRTSFIRLSTAAMATGVLLVSGAGVALAETVDNDGAAAFGDPGQLAQHLVEEHDYLDVECVQSVSINEATFTIDAEEFLNPIALRLQGIEGGKQLILDPTTGKAYPAPAGDSKIDFVIVCEEIEPEEPGEPPIETDGPTEAAGPDTALVFGGGALLVGLGAVAYGRRRILQG